MKGVDIFVMKSTTRAAKMPAGTGPCFPTTVTVPSFRSNSILVSKTRLLPPLPVKTTNNFAANGESGVETENVASKLSLPSRNTGEYATHCKLLSLLLLHPTPPAQRACFVTLPPPVATKMDGEGETKSYRKNTLSTNSFTVPYTRRQ